MRTTRFLGAASLAIAFAISTPAFAQTTSTTPPADETSVARDDTICVDDNSDGVCDSEDSRAIVVTGSRLRVPEATNFAPTVSVNQQYLEDRNLTNVADALNELPGYRGSVTPAGAQGSFGQGVNFVNTFGLGSNRNLTLLNGRRVVTSNSISIFGNASPGTQVDLNIIPSILVDRIERLSVGGAPAYGSDAIAGVTNFIMRDRFEGVEVRGTTRITERGDNFTFAVQGAAGFNFPDNRGNVAIAAFHEEVTGALFNSRDFYRDNLGFLTNPCSIPGPSCTSNLVTNFRSSPLTNDGRINGNIGFNNATNDGFPGSILVRNVTIPSLSRGGVIANIGALRPLDFNYQFGPNGDLIPYNRGILFNGPINSAASRASGGDGFTFSDFSQLTSNLRRTSVSLFANYDLTDGVTAFVEGLYYRGYGDELVQQPTFNSTLFGGASSALNFSVDNPFLTPQARNLLVTNGYQRFLLSRANVDLSDNTGFSQNDLYRGVVGLRGDLQLGGRDFNWEVAGVYGRNDFYDYGQGINQQNFVNAVNVTRNAAGQIVCDANPAVNAAAASGVAPKADPACVPLNLFGEGRPSQAALDYILQDVSAASRFEQKVFNINFGGSPFDLFGNPVAFNVGYEHREESASFTPDAFQQAGLGRSVAITPNSGSYNLDEVFGELLVTVISPDNDSFIHRLELNGKARYVDNTVNGGFLAWTAGGLVEPFAGLAFRGNFTRSSVRLRSPSCSRPPRIRSSRCRISARPQTATLDRFRKPARATAPRSWRSSRTRRRWRRASLPFRGARGVIPTSITSRRIPTRSVSCCSRASCPA